MPEGRTERGSEVHKGKEGRYGNKEVEGGRGKEDRRGVTGML